MPQHSDPTGGRDPRYRFHGRTAPTPGARTPLAALDTPPVVDGVATLRIYDPIDSWGGDWGVSAKEFAATLDQLGDDTETIALHLNSPGGEVFEAFAILNQLRAHRARVVAHVDGLAASAASFIAAGSDEVVMGRNSELMIHDAWGICIGNAADMRDLGGRLDHLSNNIASVYAGHAGGDVAFWRDAMLAETWYSADEAVAAGLADRVAGDELDAEARNAFDRSVFQYSSRADAPPPPLPGAEGDASPEQASVDEAPAAPSHRQQIRHRMNARRAARV